jgi:cell division protein ZapE
MRVAMAGFAESIPAPPGASGPLAAYRARIGAGTLQADPAQEPALLRLQALHGALAAPVPAAARNGLLARIGLGREQPPPAPRGVYLYGGVGRGKSMLMDLFFAGAPIEAKRRVHFHAFMLEIHARLHERRHRHPREREPLRRLAAQIATDTRVLCFDELVVANIADAMILGRLFQALLDAGVVVVATSNFPPGRLYEDGLQRDLFLPFIALLEERLDVIALDGASDHRLARLAGRPHYFTPLGEESAARLEELFLLLTDGAAGEEERLAVGSRTLAVPRAARGVAFFAFEDLCARALGAADYLALTSRYHTLFLSGVPRLGPDRRNEARRFMTLVDALWEARRNLVLSAEVTPEALHPAGEGAFEFQRTASRLQGMQSASYVEEAQARAGMPPEAGFQPFALTTDLL